MSDKNDPGYRIESPNPFFLSNKAIVEFEIRPSNTVTFVSEVDLSEIEQIRRLAGKDKPTYTAFIAKAVAMAFKEFPYANRRICRRLWLPFVGPRLQQFTRCDITVACERNEPGTEVAVFADVIRDVDKLCLADITDWLKNLNASTPETNQQWRTFSLLITRFPQWLSRLLIRIPYMFPSQWVKYRGGATLISSPAKYGVDVVAATWSWPLGISFGLVKERPVVRDGQVVPCTTFALTLNFDRRVMAGAQGARFFNRLVEILEHAGTEMAAFLTANEPKAAHEEILAN
jgi:pyruvate/2-oxoglutarate dehydrogenase complex dihydrolipoamide acyltransferase (E2) component